MAYPATFVDIQNSVIAKLRLDSTADLSKVKDWINSTYSEVCLDTEALQTVATMTLTEDVASYTLDTDTLRIKQMFVTPVGNTQGGPLREVPFDLILAKRAYAGGVANAGGSVELYAVLGLNQIEFYPTPADADVVTIYYVKAPTALSADADVPVIPEPFASKLLEYGALTQAAEFKKDPLVATFNQVYLDWLARFRSHLTRLTGGSPDQMEIVGMRNSFYRDNSIDNGC